MLRILVIALFLTNLLLLGFQAREPVVETEVEVPRPETEDSSLPTIHLFSELMQDWNLMSGNRQCFSLGPFHSSDDRDDVRSQLLEFSAYISERETQAKIEKGYWVFLAPYTSLLEANQVLISLQALGLRDVAVIYEGRWQKAISLGYFLRLRNARRRIESLQNKGYIPLTRIRRETESRYWLDFEQNPGSALFALDMENRPNDFMQRSMPCPDQNLFGDHAGDPQITVDDLALKQQDEVDES